jgi:hypothetical protein
VGTPSTSLVTLPNLDHVPIPRVKPKLVNTHSMQTRSKTGVFVPDLIQHYYLLMLNPKPPNKHYLAPHGCITEKWHLILSVPASSHHKVPIGCKWVFRVKETPMAPSTST